MWDVSECSNTGLCVCLNNYSVFSSESFEHVQSSNLKYEYEGIG